MAAGLFFIAGMAASGAPEPPAQLFRERAQVRWTQVPRQVLAFYYGGYVPLCRDGGALARSLCAAGIPQLLGQQAVVL